MTGRVSELTTADSVGDNTDIHNLVHDSQYWFVKGKSCLADLLSFCTGICEAACNDESLDVVYEYHDFSKAFDKLPPHQRLLKKSVQHGVRGKVYDWIRP